MLGSCGIYQRWVDGPCCRAMGTMALFLGPACPPDPEGYEKVQGRGPEWEQRYPAAGPSSLSVRATTALEVPFRGGILALVDYEMPQAESG